MMVAATAIIPIKAKIEEKARPVFFTLSATVSVSFVVPAAIPAESSKSVARIHIIGRTGVWLFILLFIMKNFLLDPYRGSDVRTAGA
jgi:hypothetical protein